VGVAADRWILRHPKAAARPRRSINDRRQAHAAQRDDGQPLPDGDAGPHLRSPVASNRAFATPPVASGVSIAQKGLPAGKNPAKRWIRRAPPTSVVAATPTVTTPPTTVATEHPAEGRRATI
jgi:hypothetical protein